jgi:voltage-gated potassium channel
MNPTKWLKKATDTFRELIVIYLIVLALATAGFAHFENKSVGESLWWASVTSMTVGYGDMYPNTVPGKLIAVGLMHIVPLFIIPLFVAMIIRYVSDDPNEFTDEEQEEIKRLLREIRERV